MSTVTVGVVSHERKLSKAVQEACEKAGLKVLYVSEKRSEIRTVLGVWYQGRNRMIPEGSVDKHLSCRYPLVYVAGKLNGQFLSQLFTIDLCRKNGLLRRGWWRATLRRGRHTAPDRMRTRQSASLHP